MVVVVFAVFVLLSAIWRRRLASWRNAVLTAAVVWGGLLVGLTELLSRFNAITPNALLAGWLVGGLVVVAVLFAVPRVEPDFQRAKEPGWLPRCAIGFLALVAFVSAVVAWIGPPNNTDAMTYHLPRVVHWMQNHNVEFYPVQYYPAELDPYHFIRSQEIRQLTMPPAGEYVVLNLWELSGSERLSTMVQWFAYVGCLIGVWSVAEVMGAGACGCALAALVAGTMPIAYMESVTAQNDLIGSFWMICFLWAMLRLCNTERIAGLRRFNLLMCGVALGLALLTKATAYIFAAPLVLGLCAIMLRRHGWLACPRLAAVLALAGLINLPMGIRDFRLSGVLVGNAQDHLLYANAPASVGNTISNVIRSLAFEWVIPVDDVPAKLESAARAVHLTLGLNPDDATSTFASASFHMRGDWYLEDSAPNPLQMTLLVAAGICAAAAWRRWGRAPGFLLLAVTVSFLAFSAYLRWQPWHSRLLITLLFVASPAIGIVMQHWSRRITAIAALLLSIGVIPWIVLNTHHRLIGPTSIFNMDRETRRFLDQRPWQAAFRSVADYPADHGCRQVGIICTTDDWEYALDEMLLRRDPAIRIETYPQPWRLDPNTINRGWDESLKPYCVVKFEEGVPKIIQVSSELSAPAQR
jgi:hypothetical protein